MSISVAWCAALPVRLPWGYDGRTAMLTAQALKAKAAELGFDLCGIAPAETLPELARLREWLDRGYEGTMSWMGRSARRRLNPELALTGARAIISLATVYNTGHPYSTEVPAAGQALVSRYAWGEDYHEVVGRRTQALMAWMHAQVEAPFEAWAYVDTGPIQEKVFAQRAGLGWVGKNTCLINERLGSWVFLSDIICTLPLPVDEPAVDQCGTCTLCLEACPTRAFVEPYVLDARRCISYLTIELRKDMPVDLREAVGTHIYGCDICQEVCPFNQDPAVSPDPAWQPRPGLVQPTLATLWRASDTDWRRLVAGTAMTRVALPQMRRNLAVAIGNAGQADLLAPGPAAEGDDPSAQEPMVRRHVRWARDKMTS